MNFDEKNSIYTELDCIYDTRLATLEAIGPRLAKHALKNGYHFLRVADKWPMISLEDFKRVYALRDEHILSLSQPTLMHEVIKNFITEAITKVVKSPFKSDIEIYINTYPYKLKPYTCQSLMEQVQKVYSNAVNVYLIRKDYKDLTPQYCKEKFALMTMYEWGDWIEYHSKSEAFVSSPMRDVSIMLPELYWQEPVPERSELKKITKDMEHPFRKMEIVSSPILDIHLLPIEYYSADLSVEFVKEYTKDI